MEDKEVIIGPITNWAEDELSRCLGVDIVLEGNLIHLGDKYYIEVGRIDGKGIRMEGRVEIAGDLARQIIMATQIENAESTAELPAGLTEADDRLRDLAMDKFAELHKEGKY